MENTAIDTRRTPAQLDELLQQMLDELGPDTLARREAESLAIYLRSALAGNRPRCSDWLRASGGVSCLMGDSHGRGSADFEERLVLSIILNVAYALLDMTELEHRGGQSWERCLETCTRFDGVDNDAYITKALARREHELLPRVTFVAFKGMAPVDVPRAWIEGRVSEIRFGRGNYRYANGPLTDWPEARILLPDGRGFGVMVGGGRNPIRRAHVLIEEDVAATTWTPAENGVPPYPWEGSLASRLMGCSGRGLRLDEAEVSRTREVFIN